MPSDTQQIVNKAWNLAHVLRDDGLSYMPYTEQITFLLFLKMADGQTRPPYNRKPIVPPELGWRSLLGKDGDALEVHYRQRHGVRSAAGVRGQAGASQCGGRGPTPFCSLLVMYYLKRNT